MVCLNQGVSYSHTFCGKCDFPKLLIGYQKVKIIKSECKSEKVRKANIKTVQFRKNQEKKDIKIDMVCAT